MPDARKTLFGLVVEPGKLHQLFEVLRTAPGYEPARLMMDEVYQTFEDPEGNFLEQFQTQGFNARCFELYLYAYFSRSGFVVDRSHVNPDFLVSRNGFIVAVEATTVNPPTSGVLGQTGRKINELSPNELREYLREELPIRFGSPLFSKLQKQYWGLPHCQDRPFAIAIEAFHDTDALGLSDYALTRYIFGLGQTGRWNEGGELAIETAEVREHALGEKRIPSGFFGQPGTENVSAVIFTNSGTVATFARMGFQHGMGCKSLCIIRKGFCFNPDPNAMDPTFFSYDLDHPPLVEPWGQGLLVLHNPNCRNPIPKDFFKEAVQGYVQDGMIKTDHPQWHPMSSVTLMLHLGEAKQKLAEATPWRSPTVAVGAMPKEKFEAAYGFVMPKTNPIIEEQGWFSDDTDAFLGVVVRDKVDNDWGYVVLARDACFRFRAIDTRCSLQTRDQARKDLQTRIAELLSHPQRVFPQGDEAV